MCVHLEKVIVPIIPLAAGFRPYENDEVDFTLVPPGDLQRALADPRLRGPAAARGGLNVQ